LFSFPSFFYFDYRFVVLTVIFAIASCIIGVECSMRINTRDRKGPVLIFGSILLAFSFWLTHLFVSLSVELPFSQGDFSKYALVNFLCVFTACFLALKMSNIGVVNEKQYILGSLLIASSILVADIIGFSLLFRKHLEFKAIFIVMTSVLTLGSSFSLFRFLIQITNDDNFGVTKWKYIGCIAAGTALAGIPFITFVSIIDFDAASLTTSETFIPFVFVMMANLILMLVPDLFGDKLLLKNIHAYKSLFNYNPGAVFSVDLNGKIINANKEASVITGYTLEELNGLSIQIFFRDKDKNAINTNLESVLAGKIKNIETKIIHKQGAFIDVRITAVRSLLHKEIIGTFGIVEDITEKKLSEEKIKFLAYHDELTKLPNRTMLKNEMVKLASKNASVFNIMLIDFDRFKRINDTFGHSFGDKILIQIGEKLREIVQEKGIVARIGGDEFLILVPFENFEPLAEHIITKFQSPLTLNGFEILLTASMGAASYPEHTRNIDDLYKFADIAMYHSKENGANGYSIYNEEMADLALNKLDLENDLRKAIEHKRLWLYFQPKYNTVHKRMTGSEVLLRWKDNTKGFIPPNVFIPIAEESGLIIPLERFVIAEVCAIVANWKDQGKEVSRVSINISLITLLQEGFAGYVLDHLKQYNLSGELLELEITERVVMKNEDDVNSTLQKLRQTGIKISIDDFGTGYSSLSYLDKLHVDILKIDQSFIRNIQTKKEVISAIISLAKSLNLKVIAEGVETSTQIELLKYLGCEEVQGYYFSPPVPVEEFELQLPNKIRELHN
jgi:diguanylate cyclase (GGDEF)-like protein/PAS domain S-box-containing protein